MLSSFTCWFRYDFKSMPFNWTHWKFNSNGQCLYDCHLKTVDIWFVLLDFGTKSKYSAQIDAFKKKKSKQSQNNEARRLIISLLWFNWPFYAYKRTYFNCWRHTRTLCNQNQIVKREFHLNVNISKSQQKLNEKSK